MMPNDYVMRIVQQFIQAILSIMRARKAEKYEDAVAQIQTACRFYLRTDLALLLFHPPEQIVELMRLPSGEIDTERCVLAADLLNELALVREAEQKEAEALHLKKICLHLYNFALPKEKQFQTAEYFSKVETLEQELKEQT